MKTKFNKFLILASAGALTGLVWAEEAQIKTGANAGKTDAEIELRSGLDAKHATHSQFQRASDLMGTDIVNQQSEKIGSIKDVMVDLQSGHAPFAVVSSGGFFGVGDRLMAIPVSSFSQTSGESLSLNIDKQRLQSAPSFDRAAWPDMSDEAWSSQVYSYYGAQPTANRSLESASETTTIINEPSGADNSRSDYSSIPSRSDSTSQEFGETTTGLHRDRTPRQGLGVEDLTKNEQKIYNPGGYAASDSFIQSDASGAERSRARVGTTTIESDNRNGWSKAGATPQHGKVRRASELIGMEVKNAQGERVGEVKDVVLDLQSGRVAYTVLSAAGYAGMADRLYAVPPAVFTRSTDERTLVFNTDKEMLKAAPSFEKNSWTESNNQQFTTEVYRYYKQPIYWQSSGAIREPSGSELKNKDQQDSDKWERGNSPKIESRPEIQEPSGAEPNQAQPDNSSSDSNQSGATAAAPDSPAAEPERYQSPAPETEDTLQPDQSSATKETEELKAPTQGAAAEANQDAAAEPAGAATATTPATSDDQAGGNADRNLSERLRTEFKNDTELSAKTQNVQVSAANGRITLRGSVASEEEKKAIGMKAQTAAGGADKVDNQLRVTTETPTP